MKYLPGGAFLFKAPVHDRIFLPEAASEEHSMIFETASSFVQKEILPIMQRIEAKEEGLAEALFLKLGELGLLGAHMPEEYGGLDLDANTVALMLSGLSEMGSFNTPYAAHTGIGMLPILYFGTEDQKLKYLPPMISGELIGSYCLTEPTSGSDAMAAKTQASYDEAAKTYTLNGQKMWITNAGYAGIFIVFAQLDGDKFTAFIVERFREGLSFGAEEHKLGIHGSSTRQVFLENVVIPSENLLGQIGKGHLIAFNVLNMGRFKLGTLTMGGCKNCVRLSAEYASQRLQFGKAIGTFGAIQYKIAEQTVYAVAVESASYRLSELLTQKIADLKRDGVKPGEAKLQAAREYAIECSILKVTGSEAIDYCVDELLQVYGGMGYSEEAAPARMYRDARINRIYEGTNEINRLLIIDQIMKRGMKGELPLLEVLQSGQVETSNFPQGDAMRSVVVKVIGYIGRRQMEGKFDMEKEQQVVMALSDMCSALFLFESLWMRIEKRKSLGIHTDPECWEMMLSLQHLKAAQTTHDSLYELLNRLFEGDMLDEKFQKLTQMFPLPKVKTVEYRRRISDKVLSEGGTFF